MNAGGAGAHPFFLQVAAATPARRIFCLHHRPASAPRGALVYVPPFAEEMNKSRRMAALQARALAAAGWQVLQIDLASCGDSEGDFATATWAGWLQDIAAARHWLAEQAGHTPWLWGLRLGALLATCSAQQQPAPGLLLWQPVLSGRQHLQQFLRLKAGAEWLGQAEKAQAAAKPIDQLQAGETVEIAGYALAPALALPMAEAELRWPAGLPRAVWFELSPREGATLGPASQRVLAAAPAGCAVHSAALQGPSFWQAQEIETSPALLAATAEALAV